MKPVRPLSSQFRPIGLTLGMFASLLMPALPSRAALTLPQALEQSRVKGGLCVIVGAKDAALAEEMAAKQPFIVQCLMKDDAAVQGAREALLAKNHYGPVSVEALRTATLPYADGVVSVLHLADPALVSQAECLRVLRPFGELIVADAAGVKVITKPRLAGTDDWTHWRHGADRNPVSHDIVVDVPRRVHWLQPNDVMSERAHFITANGRVFIQDRGTLTARDACNGLPLWQAKIKEGKEFDWEWSVKVAALAVSVGERVYVLADDNKFKALDAATGKPALVYDKAGVPSDVLVVENGKNPLGVLVVADAESVRALDAATGSLLWQMKADNARTLMASREAVFFIEGQDKRGAAEGKISSIDLITGKVRWQQSYDWARRTDLGAFGNDSIVYEIRAAKDASGANEKGKAEERFNLAVISAKTGQLVEKVKGTGSSARHGEFRAGFWQGENLITEATLNGALNVVGFKSGNFTKPALAFRANDVGDRGFGHCYPPVLTDRFYLNGQLNFTDLTSGSTSSNQITRGSCNTARSGYVPANGMIYTFPKHCGCFPMLDGNVALAPRNKALPQTKPELFKGPAWPAQPKAAAAQDNWPTFRHDASRTAGTKATVPADVKVLWSADIAGPDDKRPFGSEWAANPYLSGPVTAPVVADGTVYVAQSDSHRLMAIDAATGKEKWHFITEGRIDSPPTIHEGMVLVGSRCGYVYNLRASDGALAWKLRVAPTDERIAVNGQVESPWPVPGSVLVVDKLAYVAAGLHPNSDGGIQVVCFDPATAAVVWTNRFDDLGFNDPWPEPYDPNAKRPGSDPWRTIHPLEYRYFDLLVRDGDGVAISRCVFDLKTGKRELRKTKGYYFIKESGAWMPRTAWRYGTEREGAPTAAALGASVFGTIPASSKLFRTDFKPGQAFNDDWVTAPQEERIAKAAFAINKIHGAGAKWEVDSQDSRRGFNRAMLVAGDNLFTAAANGSLTVNATADGRKVAEQKLEPVCWDGMAASGGRLFVSTQSGKVLCLGAK